MHKIITVLFLVSFVIYTVTNPLGGDTPFKWMVYALMVVLLLCLCLNGRLLSRYKYSFTWWFLGFTILFIAQIFFAHEKFINNLILWCAFVCLSLLLVTQDLGKPTWQTLLILMIGDYIYGLPSFFTSFTSQGYSAGWSGMFQNANTHSIFLCSVLIAVLLSCSNRKLRILVLLSILVGIYATRSRNAIMVFLMIVGGFIFEYRLQKYQKWFPLVLVGILIFAGYYMLVIEPYAQQNELELFGKKDGSAGRSLQILYITSNFELSLWGNGRYINSIVEDNTGYPVHNMFIASLYVLGIGISMVYFGFIYWLYCYSDWYKFKVTLLAVHFYYFFEPGYFFCVQLCYFLPMFVICANYWNNSSHKIVSICKKSCSIPRLLANL